MLPSIGKVSSQSSEFNTDGGRAGLECKLLVQRLLEMFVVGAGGFLGGVFWNV